MSTSRQELAGRNPLLDYSIDKFFLITDGITFTAQERAVLDHVGDLFASEGVSYIGNANYGTNNSREAHLQMGQNDRGEFENFWRGINGDVDMLRHYAERMNPELHRQLSESGEDLKEILWKNYQRRFNQEDSLHFDLCKQMIVQNAMEHKDAHVVLVL